MEGDIAKEDFHEFEMLLGEIPNATYGNHLRGQITFTDSSQKLDSVANGEESEFSPLSKSAKLYNLHQPASYDGSKYCNDADFSKLPEYLKLQGKASNGYKDREAIHMEDMSNLHDERPLSLLFEEMSFKESLASKPMSPASIMKKKSHLNHNCLLNEQYMNHHNKLLLGYGPVDMNFPHSGNLNGFNLSSIGLEAKCPVLKRNEFAIPNDRIDGHCNIKLLKSDDNYEPNQISNCCQQFFPVNPCLNSYQFLPTAQEMQLPNVFQTKYCVETQSHSNHITQPGLMWHGMGEGRFDRHYQQQYLYAQHLQNYRPEPIQFREGVDLGILDFNKSDVQPYVKANTFYDKSKILGYCQYQLPGSSGRHENFRPSDERKMLSSNGPSSSSKGYLGHQCFPEKILTRSHGVNSVRVLRPNPFSIDQPQLFDKNSLRRSNRNSHHPQILSNGSLQLNHRSNKGSCPNTFIPRLVSKSIRTKYNSVDEVAGRIYLMAKDQNECHFLQRKFAEGNREDIDKIFSEVIVHIVELMTDPFGNYVVQKLLEVCNEEQMMLILEIMTRNTNELYRISCNMHGTRAVQKVIENVRTPEQISIVVSSLEPCIILLMKHINGNHVAQRCLQYLSKHCARLIDTAITHFVELATDRQGCCVLQRCLEHAEHDQKKMLIAEISAYALIFSKDQFGNYVVQFVLDLKDPWATPLVLEHLMGNYEHLSVQKYSSNVVEKCLKLADEEYLVKIIHELLSSPLLLQIIQDRFGNYVIQTALNVSKEDLHADLLEAILSYSSTLGSNPYGKKVLSAALQYMK